MQAHTREHTRAQHPTQQHSLIVTSPSELCSILSMPLGPREDLRMRATALAAWMLPFTASVPVTRVLPSCSLMMMKGRPNSSNARLILSNLDDFS